jgi:hypothetical protein
VDRCELDSVNPAVKVSFRCLFDSIDRMLGNTRDDMSQVASRIEGPVQCGRLNSKPTIPAHPNPPLHRRKLDRPRLRLRDTKKHIPRLRVQQIVLLHRPAIRAVIREVPVLRLGCHPIKSPTLERRCQRAVHGRNVRESEKLQGVATFEIDSAIAMNANDFDLLPAIRARYLRGGDERLLGLAVPGNPSSSSELDCLRCTAAPSSSLSARHRRIGYETSVL